MLVIFFRFPGCMVQFTDLRGKFRSFPQRKIAVIAICFPRHLRLQRYRTVLKPVCLVFYQVLLVVFRRQRSSNTSWEWSRLSSANCCCMTPNQCVCKPFDLMPLIQNQILPICQKPNFCSKTQPIAHHVLSKFKRTKAQATLCCNPSV